MADDLHAVDFDEVGIQPFMEFVPFKRLHGVSLTQGPLLDIRKSRRGAPINVPGREVRGQPGPDRLSATAPRRDEKTVLCACRRPREFSLSCSTPHGWRRER